MYSETICLFNGKRSTHQSNESFTKMSMASIFDIVSFADVQPFSKENSIAERRSMLCW